jgi:hypothetical protein
LRRLTAAALLCLGCASPGMPPGGPPDAAAPQIVSIIPDSAAVGISPREVIFRFDEVVSERPQGATSLEALFLISPRDGAPETSWHRDAIGVRPRRGWRPNTPYTVLMMPGLTDLRGNIRNTGASTFFSTGKTIPRTRLSGVVFDWVAGTPAAGAFVESFVRPDSLRPFIAVADSNGAFTIPHLPPARYTVRAYQDRNKNFGIDPGEAWDTTSVQLTDSATATILVFAHDSVPPRIRDLFMVDSVSIQVAFDRPVDPSQTLAPANFAVIGPDSVPLPILSVGPPAADTAIRPAVPAPGAPAPAAPPAAAPARRDTTMAAKPSMPRTAPISTIVIKLERPLASARTYRVRARGIRGLLGHTGDSERGLTTPAPRPAVPNPAVTPPASPPIKR